ncbi:MAG: hypothetical protein ACRCS9_14085 [Hyphomicrobium sp.]
MTQRPPRSARPAPSHGTKPVVASGGIAKSSAAISEAGVASADARRRREDLARVLPLWPSELADLSLAGRRHMLKVLERALRGERRRGIAGHWAYDLARHASLFALWRAERAELKQLAARCQYRDRQSKNPATGRGRKQSDNL